MQRELTLLPCPETRRVGWHIIIITQQRIHVLIGAPEYPHNQPRLFVVDNAVQLLLEAQDVNSVSLYITRNTTRWMTYHQNHAAKPLKVLLGLPAFLCFGSFIIIRDKTILTIGFSSSLTLQPEPTFALSTFPRAFPTPSTVYTDQWY
ncbi:hypothetical protein PGT21_014866 [Puccinia graminis f. sp. tritici]|uniref:Uncharacterized protein n=1 Tax=Puccinia graminis f. sp. tritici TaxID=56615 RepID=A0A5B0QFB5_PUCGR|nr:hypothetical protein PGT21_014866 [Puccinia graminis f. sp. tritici]